MSELYTPADEDVILFSGSDEAPFVELTWRVDDLRNFITEGCFEKSFKNGVNCKLLKAKAGGGWQKGKIQFRFQLVFIPDGVPERLVDSPSENIVLTDEDAVFMPFVEPGVLETSLGNEGVATTRVKEIRENMATAFEMAKFYPASPLVGPEGLECEVLLAQSGGGWRKGNIELRLVFVPGEDEPSEQ